MTAATVLSTFVATSPPSFLIALVSSSFDFPSFPAMTNFMPSKGREPSGAELTGPVELEAVTLGKIRSRFEYLYFFLKAWNSFLFKFLNGLKLIP